MDDGKQSGNGQKHRETGKDRNSLLRPDLYYSAFWAVDFPRLADMGIKYLIIDVDSTIAHVYKREIDPRARKVLEDVLASGLMKKACLVSNTVYRFKEARVKAMAELMKIPYVAAGFLYQKPHIKPFRDGLQLMGATPGETAVIGDQIHTDILGGNRLGMITVLVKPLGVGHWTTFLLLRHLRQNHFLRRIGLKFDDIVEKAEHELEKRVTGHAREETEREIKLLQMEEEEKKAEEAEEIHRK